MRLAVIATAAGAFSGLFGVGGGAVIVPLLILWMGYEEREATGTSLAAIPVIAALGVLVQGLHSRSPSPTGRCVVRDRPACGISPACPRKSSPW